MQAFKTAMDPVTGAATATSPVNLYMGALPALAVQAAAGGNPNPPTTTGLPSNYYTKLPTMPTTANIAPAAATTTGSTPSGYYWVCLRRPANLFAPVSTSNPMVVVDSMRFSYLDGTGMLITNPSGATPPQIPSIKNDPITPPPATTVANYPYSVQRYQPYRGGHAVPLAPPIGATISAPGNPVAIDSRYGYSEQIVVPGADSLVMSTQGVYFNTGGTFYATPPIYHTLGWANEYEQGSLNSMAEPWDYFPFHDRDFTSVAELLLVPGCPPGLFTKQFVEFAPTAATAANVFGAVVPSAVPPVGGPSPTIQGPGTTTFIQAFNTASTPFGYFYNTSGGPWTAQPRSYPYLNDEFFYTAFGGPNLGAVAGTQIDLGGNVGGYGADGWYKMFEFFEVPSQSIGAIGPVMSGSNFDWYRQDIKPGQLNLNLIMDEEVFFSIAGHQAVTQSNGQYVSPGDTNSPGAYINPNDQFQQQLLNFNQIPGLPAPLASNAVRYTLFGSPSFPFMLAAGSNPIPLLVTSILKNGTPATAVPIATTQSASPGMAAQDPIGTFFFGANNAGAGPGLQNTATAPIVGPPFPFGNSLKTAWVQFLNLRHGGSGYIFGNGLGLVGQNSAMVPASPAPVMPANFTGWAYATGIPAERPFRSLSYPDINMTVMRPAALPPSVYTNPVANPAASVAGGALYAGDPGLRNPTLFVGYPSGNYPGTLPASAAGLTEYTLTTQWGTTYSPAIPPPAPVRRLFQVPDSYNGAAVDLTGGLGVQPGPLTGPGPFTFPQVAVGPSNSGETGDPYLNNLSPVVAAGVTPVYPYIPSGTLPTVAYTNAGTAYAAMLTNGNVNLYWPGGTAPAGAGTAANILSQDAMGNYTVQNPILLSTIGLSNPYLGANAGGGNADAREHPYWRSEQLQRMINLTTPRTHQYAVWMTIGFFEVKRQGDQGMFVYDPRLAFDILGPEIGAANGKSTRYRGFFLVDRLQLTGYNPQSPTGFRQAVVYRQRIQ
jgi:hypothetical protein